MDPGTRGTGRSFACELHHVDQEGRAQGAIDGHTFLIQAIDELDEILRRANFGGFREIGVPHHGELAQRRKVALNASIELKRFEEHQCMLM
jgi:hypothetical protein